MKQKKNSYKDEEEIDFYNIEYKLNTDLVDNIENLFNTKPDGRKKEENKEWKKKINHVIKMLNKERGMKIYDIIK